MLESASVSYGKATSYLPVIDLLKGYFKIEDRDYYREIREKLTGKLLALDEALKPTLPALLALLYVPMDDSAWRALDPAQRRQRTLEAGEAGAAARGAGATDYPDLRGSALDRYGDPSVARWPGREPGTGAPAAPRELPSRVPARVGQQELLRTVSAGHAPAESAGELLDALLSEDPGLVPLKQLLVKRGNPFFLEETVRTLLETKALAGERGRYRLTQPVQTIQVPATVQAMLASRIDRLTPEDKRLLQICSVVGKDVPFTLLEAVADLPDEALRRGLDHLQAAEFLHQTGLFPDFEYSFAHALTYEVTYGGLLHGRRRELHARIVDVIETFHRDRLDGEIERLAYHAARGELREKAVHYLRQAGIKAAARSALPVARAWFEQALAILETLPESQSTLERGFDIRLELRPVLNMLGEVPRPLLREAELLADRLNDDTSSRPGIQLHGAHPRTARRAERGPCVRDPRAGDRPVPWGLGASDPDHDSSRARPLPARRVRASHRARHGESCHLALR